MSGVVKPGHTEVSTAPKIRIVAAMHQVAREWALHHGYLPSEYVTVTQPDPLQGLSRDTQIILVRSTLRFQDYQRLLDVLSRFPNVRYET